MTWYPQAVSPRRPRSDTGWWFAALAMAGLVALIGIATPRYTLRATLIATIALTAVATVQAIVRFCQQVPSATTSAFDQRPAHTPPALPPHIRSLQPANLSQPITHDAQIALRVVATERLWAHYRLNLHEPTDHEAIQALMSPPLWNAIWAPVTGPYSSRHADLDYLLNELEYL